MCDTRVVKHQCLDCSKRWHARGFAREHILEDRHGVKQPFAAWISSPAEVPTPVESEIAPRDPQSTDEILPEIADDVMDISDPIDVDTADADAEAEAAAEAPESITERFEVIEDTEILPDASEETQSEPNAERGSATPADANNVAQEISVALSGDDATELSLDDVLARFPTTDPSILDALADYIFDAIKIEDGLFCGRINKCRDGVCRVRLLHDHHVEKMAPCGESFCQTAFVFSSHLKGCKAVVCPFCIRVKQRRLLCKLRWLEHLTSQRAITVNERKKEGATAELEELNRLVVDNRLPIFNFPVYMWHIEDPVVVKAEQTAAVDVIEAPAPPPEAADGTQATPDASASDPHLNASGAQDHIARLVSAVGVDDASATDRKKLEDAIQLAFNIVDASYCSPVKASRCLLACQSILVHLQHHVNLQVCQAPLCQQVEFHFAHLSACSASSSCQQCEYCLRVSEYEYARAIEFMESEQLEAKAKVQSLVSAITRSLHSDPVNEREQNVMQLDDELQQTEEHARVLMEKLSRTAGKLRRVRRRIQSHPRGITSIGHQALPRHFIKTRGSSAAKSN
ncbi:hypothetical protein ATCC90586_008347 [Pythium insidiosum]|nr:hypothetical protein ATCC90586_008347 [Pythium insidiosum]